MFASFSFILQVINLISSTKFAEKSSGYMATSIILNNATDFFELILNALRNDMVGGTDEAKVSQPPLLQAKCRYLQISVHMPLHFGNSIASMNLTDMS